MIPNIRVKVKNAAHFGYGECCCNPRVEKYVANGRRLSKWTDILASDLIYGLILLLDATQYNMEIRKECGIPKSSLLKIGGRNGIKVWFHHRFLLYYSSHKVEKNDLWQWYQDRNWPNECRELDNVPGPASMSHSFNAMMRSLRVNSTRKGKGPWSPLFCTSCPIEVDVTPGKCHILVCQASAAYFRGFCSSYY